LACSSRCITPSAKMMLIVIPMPMWMLMGIFLTIDLFAALSGNNRSVAVEAIWPAPPSPSFSSSSTSDSRGSSPRAWRALNCASSPRSSRAQPFTIVEPFSFHRQHRRRPQVPLGIHPSRRTTRRAIGRSARENRTRRPLGPHRRRAPRPPGGQPPRSHQAERSHLSAAPISLLRIRAAAPGDRAAVAEFNRLLALEPSTRSSTRPCWNQAWPSPSPNRIGSATGLPKSTTRPRSPVKPPSPENGATGEMVGSGGSRAFMSPPRFAAAGSSADSLSTSRAQAHADREVIGLRLYVEKLQRPRPADYQSLGMKSARTRSMKTSGSIAPTSPRALAQVRAIARAISRRPPNRSPKRPVHPARNENPPPTQSAPAQLAST